MPTRILVVDDEPDLELLINLNFSEQVKSKEIDFVFAGDGEEALSRLSDHPDIDVVFTDINMPRMDGLTLLARIAEDYPSLRTVIVSAYGDMSNIRTAMNSGAFDFITKPIDLKDLELTMQKTVREALERREALANYDRLKIMENELSVATRIQTSILPRTFPPFPDRKEIEIFAHMTPAREVGGDFYDFFFVDNDRLGFVIGDVSGKGVPSAMFMAVSRTFLKATALTGLSPRDCLQRINPSLFRESVLEMFVTLFYGLLDLRTGEVRFSNGGHNSPYILHADGSVEEMDNTGGIMLGGVENSRYKENEIVLQKGDSIVLYTDGVTEAFDAAEEEYGEQRLEACLKQLAGSSPETITNALIEDINRFIDGAPQSDDLTMLVLKYLGKSPG